ncbi:hypothetical protein [Planktotalea sp.]|uniref:hypothetical protein n=1 Tax=Planktotalea sp. TaxID=2029877 RepID=UPI003D6B04F5
MSENNEFIPYDPEILVEREVIPGTTSTWNIVFQGGAVVEVKHAALRMKAFRKPGGVARYPELVIRSGGTWYPVGFNQDGDTDFKDNILGLVRVDDD